MAGRRMTTAEITGLSPTIQTIVAEAAGENFEGMRRVARVIHSRTMLPRWKGMTTDQVVQQRKQFSGWERPDRVAFLQRQPREVFDQAGKALASAKADVAKGPTADHYLTRQLFNSPKRPPWANKMKVVEQFGNHVFLKE